MGLASVLHEPGNAHTATSWVHHSLNVACEAGASDIHYECYARYCRIRVRIDGRLHNLGHPPLSLGVAISARLKVLAELDIAEKRLPQDGRLSLTRADGTDTACRLSTCPGIFGEKLVLRLLNSEAELLPLSRLGFEATQQGEFEQALTRRQGLILVTGPTGSGKTMTLYSALNALNQEHTNIISVEHPVEMPLSGINQISVHPAAGLTFATALRACLRQDPDILMIGEIRDAESARIACHAALTGHLVLTTLHCDRPADALLRLKALSLSPAVLNSILLCVLGQRLLRKLCPHCCYRLPVPEALASRALGGSYPGTLPELIGAASPGCAHCQHGYHGRCGAYEVILPASCPNPEALMAGKRPPRKRETLPTLAMRQAAIHKVLQGQTSLEEVNRLLPGYD